MNKKSGRKTGPKYSFLELKPYLTKKGRTFTEFLDSAGSRPARRSWNDGTHSDKGVSEITANRMLACMVKVFESWGEEVPKNVLTMTTIYDEKSR